MPPATENACVDASSVTVESGLPRLMERARAWATGDVERIESAAAAGGGGCLPDGARFGASEGDLLARVRQAWLAAIEKYLQGRRSPWRWSTWICCSGAAAFWIRCVRRATR